MANATDSRTLGTDMVPGGVARAWAAAPEPLSPAEMERDLATIRLPLEEATTLPARYYHDPAILEAELHTMFARMWLCVGREEDVAKPGDYLTRTVGQASVSVLADGGG